MDGMTNDELVSAISIADEKVRGPVPPVDMEVHQLWVEHLRKLLDAQAHRAGMEPIYEVGMDPFSIRRV